jgi:peroxiredoxin
VAALGGDAAGDPVPDQEVATFDGEPVTLTDYEGQPLVLNFFASWCPPCVAEMRDALEPAHRELGGEVAFLGVANQDTTEAALEVVETTGVTYDLAEDPDGELFRALGATSMPATFYIDADGRVVGRHMGALTRDQLREQIDANLLEP